MASREILKVGDEEIAFFSVKNNDYISLTDIARHRKSAETDDIIKNWMRNHGTIEFLGLWEKLSNPNFKPVEFERFKNESGRNSFVLSPSKWIRATGAIGIIAKSGRGGGTYAHKDIAFEFASWLSPEFKLYLIKEFERLKSAEYLGEQLEWNTRRMISKANYRIHTDAIKEHLPKNLTEKQINITYANEADVLNVALFGLTAGGWRSKNKGKRGNIRDHAAIEELVVLANLESYNALLIREGKEQPERLKKLNVAAISQLKSLLDNSNLKKLDQLE